MSKLSRTRSALRRGALVVSAVGLASLLSGCGGAFGIGAIGGALGGGGFGTGPRSVGLSYDARLSPGESWRDFTVLVRAPGASVADARESARYMATLHCIERAGSSAVDWVMDPDTGDWRETRSAAGEPIFTGRCSAR